MRQQRIAARVLEGCKRIRLVLVQLNSLFSSGLEDQETRRSFQPGGRTVDWIDPALFARREQEFRTALKHIERERFPGSDVRIVVFPEYAVPRTCYEGLQQFADDFKCIVIPGSHFQTDPQQPFSKNNICTIFLPQQDPITIVKKNGWQEEAEVIETDPTMPNIVHLGGDNDALGNFSISVAICRDYLMPFAQISDDGATCLLDFTRPGINIVVMCSSQVRLFEARAAFDMRDLPGPRRITALCNCAGLGIERTQTFGSALLGPSTMATDVVASLPGDAEGIVQADIDLNMRELAHVVKRPDRKTIAPIKNAQSYSLRTQQEDNAAIPLAPRMSFGPTERGVWHPAFLDHMQLNIVLHLFRTKNVDLLDAAMRNQRIRNVSAFTIEGKQDALFRYYRSVSADDSDFRLKNCLTLGDAEYDKIFVDHGHAIVVPPQNIIKYRSISVPPKERNERWEAEKAKIAALVPKQLNGERRIRLKQITELARDWNSHRVSPDDRQRLMDVFFEQREHVSTASAYETARSSVREKFVLISDGAGNNSALKVRFEAEVINKLLIPLPEVRSIYKIHTTLDDTSFDYWIDIIGEPWRLSEIILDISKQGNRLKLETGTRTMELVKFLSTESVTGVYATDLPSEVRWFLDQAMQSGAHIAQAPATPVIIDAYELLIACGTGWYQQTNSVEGPDSLSIVANISAFYVNFFFGNIGAPADQKKHYESAGDAWLRIYKRLEALFDVIIKQHFGLTDAGAAREHARQRLDELGVALRDNDRNVLRTSSMQAIFRLAKYDEQLSFRDVVDFGRLATIYENVREFRNKLTHGEERTRQLLTVYPLATPKKSKEAVRVVTTVTAELLEIVNACYEIMTTIGDPALVE